MNSTPDDEFNALAAEAEIEWPEITRQMAALFQIHGAIKLFHKVEFECSITLAGAAEGIFPDDLQNISLYKILRERQTAKPEKLDLSFVQNWLKHGTFKLKDGKQVALESMRITPFLGGIFNSTCDNEVRCGLRWGYAANGQIHKVVQGRGVSRPRQGAEQAPTAAALAFGFLQLIGRYYVNVIIPISRVTARQFGYLPNMIQPPLLGVVNAASAVSARTLTCRSPAVSRSCSMLSVDAAPLANSR